MWRTPATLAGRLDDVPERRQPVRRVILALETSCDDTCAAVVTRRRRDPLERDLLAGRPRPLRRRRPRGRLAPPPRAGRRGRRRRARAGGRRARRRRRRRRHAGPGPRRRAARRARDGQGARGGARGCRSRRSTTCRATSPRTSCSRADFEPPFLCLIACGGHTLLAHVRDHGRLRGARAHARRRGRRGVRQGRAACSASAIPGGPALRAAGRATATRRRSRSRPRAQVAGLDFSFAGLKTALLYKLRELGEEEAQRRRADLAASYQRAIVETLARRVERALEQTGLDAPRDRRRRRRQRPAARAPARRSASRSTIPPIASCAPTTPR